MQKKEYTVEIGGKKLIAEFSDLAEQANGSVMVRYGNTTVLATAVMGNPRDGLDYFPLMVDYEERFYAAGQILGSRFVRREGRPSDEAVLSGRVVDRTIRPLFDSSIRNEVQVVITVLSIDGDDPDVPAVNAASLALLTSDIPWEGPVSAIRIGKHKGKDEFEINPLYTFREDPDMELEMIVCGKNGVVNMVEVGAYEAKEEVVEAAFKRAVEEIEKIQAFQLQVAKEIGKVKQDIQKQEISGDVKALFAKEIEPKLFDTVFGKPKKATGELKSEWLSTLKEKAPDAHTTPAGDYFEEAINDLVHKEAIENGRRADGRKTNELRPLFAQAGKVSPMLHGSGIFYRGGTHVFSALTLGGPSDSLLVDSMEVQETKKRFMHHYNFPPFSSGEVGRLGGMNRRAIGHGALAEKALLSLIPSKETFPYTIRLVSECLASNGSTSMASVCASSLALMDGGVPIARHVAGIAMGLMLSAQGGSATGRELSRYVILTDIQGPEDHHGDMDFKVAGTREGVTAIQMDVKVDGIPVAILAEALEAARVAREQILSVMEGEIAAPRAELSVRAPRILTIKVLKSQIGLVIGPGGKTINGIREETGVEDISIEEDGTIFIAGGAEAAKEALRQIEELTHEYKAGDTFEGEVVKIVDFGAFVRIGRNTEGLVHASEIAPFRVERVSSILKEGDKVPVVIKEIDAKDRINLSIKAVDPDFAKRKGAVPGNTQERPPHQP